MAKSTEWDTTSLAITEADSTRRRPHVEANDLASREDLGVELERLATGPLDQPFAADAVGKAEVVLDLRALTGLPPPGARRSTSTVRRPSDAA